LADQTELVTVRVIIGKVRADALLASLDANNVPSRWVPRSLLHPEDSKALDGMFTGQRINLRIQRHKALEVGFIAERDTSTADLFP
jgi:hypothetical protein